jgi:ketosteroid isomerase-like protein
VRVSAAYEQFVRAGGFSFVSAGDGVGHHGTITFTTHMVPAGGGEPAWTGTVVAVLDETDRIRSDHQFARTPVIGDGGTRAAVTELLRRLADGDPDRIAELFAPAVDWALDWPAEGHPAVPWIRSRSTRADVADHFRTLNEFHVPEKRGGAVPTVLVDGTEAVVLGDIQQMVRATGRSYTALCALRLTVENGLITRYHVYEDSLTVAQALAGSGAVG